jgi:hypothetical protein
MICLKSKVTRKFRCKNNEEIYNVGSVYESNDTARMRELIQKGFIADIPLEETAESVPKVETSEQPYKHVGGGYYELADGTKVKGKQKAIEASKK